MSQENVDLVRGYLEAFNETGDFETGLATLDPEVELEIATQAGRDAADFRVYRGIEDVRGAIREILSPFEHTRIEIHDLRAAEDGRVVAILELLMRPKGSDAEVSSARFGYVYTLRDGKILRVQDFPDPADALAEAGLAE